MSDRHGTDDDHYAMDLEWELEGGIYVGPVPELPGCRTQGSTYEEAVKHGQEAIELWIDSTREDGFPVPPPRYFDLDSIGAAAEEAVSARR